MRPPIRCSFVVASGHPYAPGVKIAKQRHGAARVAVAHKLAVVPHRMWTDETEFRFGKEPGTPATA